MKYLSGLPDFIIPDYYLNAFQKDAATRQEILQTIKNHYHGMHVIMLCSQERYNTAMQTIRKDAEQYVIKDEDAFEKIAQIIDEGL